MDTLPTLLVVDDEIRSLETLQRILEDEFDVKTATNVAEAEAILEKEWVQIILCDQRMPDTTGVEFLKKVRDSWPEVIRMIISGYTDSDDIISAVNEAGIYQYITKPWHPKSLLLSLNNASRLYQLQKQNEALAVELKTMPDQLGQNIQAKRQQIKDHYQHNDGIVRSDESCMNEVCDKLQQIAPFDISVLLCGESGTGKELAARALHYNSLRWDKPFVVENCGALPDELLESELFGYKRGAFTGAVEDRIGLFERANGGTVFLDEIGEISPAFQVKLLRVLQEGEIRPLGSSRTRQVDVRVVAATNKYLEQEVAHGRFREDLFYRLTTLSVHLPPLRERKSDISLLAKSQLESAISSLGKHAKGLKPETLNYLEQYHWPGNVRELQNEIRQMLVMSQEDMLGPELLSPRILHGAPSTIGEPGFTIQPHQTVTGTLKQRVEELEARVLRETLVRHRWNKSRAAEELGLSRVGLRKKLSRYGLDPSGSQIEDEDSDDLDSAAREA